jgi:transporter family protein
MRNAMIYAALAGTAWGVGGYFEKAGLRALGWPPLVGITLRTAVALAILGLLSASSWRALQVPRASWGGWAMVVLGGGVLAGSLGMWCFYAALARSDNLGATLAVAFALSPVAGTLLGLARGTQPLDARSAAGLVAIVAGIVLLELSARPAR